MWTVLGQVRAEGGGEVTYSPVTCVESYREDYTLGQRLNQTDRELWYRHMKSGAESGWDYSSRWFSGTNEDQELLNVSTGDILPVDLNSFLCRNAQIIAELFVRLERQDMVKKYEDIRENLKAAIR